MPCIFVLKPHSEDNKESGEHKEEVSCLRDSVSVLVMSLCMASDPCHGDTIYITFI